MSKAEDGPRIFYLDCGPGAALTAKDIDTGSGVAADSADVPRRSLAFADASEDSSRYASPDDPEQGTILSIEQGLPAPTGESEADLIEQVVSHLKGQTIAINKPADCIRAIERLAHTVSGTD